MEELHISPSIMALKQTPAEKMLLARICQRATANDGICTNTNKELGEAVFMHPQTISDLVNRLGQTQWLQTTFEQSDTIQRILKPSSELMEGYKPITYPLNQPFTHLPKPLAYPSNQSLTYPLSQSLTPYPPITDSRLWASGKATQMGRRLCPVTNVDIGRQRNDVHYVTSKTLKHLANKQPHIFYH